MEDCNKTDDDDDDDDDDNDGFRNDHGRPTRNWYVFWTVSFVISQKNHLRIWGADSIFYLYSQAVYSAV